MTGAFLLLVFYPSFCYHTLIRLEWDFGEIFGMSKYIFVAGGVISGTGKGVSAASIGLLLKFRGHKVTLIKFDPYLNTNAGVLAPREHGECFLCDDGTETDLDLGHYERIAGISVSKSNICTSGTLHKELIEEQEKGKYLGQTIQLIPHLTDKIQQRLLDLGKDHDVVIAEVGGTVGDAESFAFFEAIRQFKQKLKNDVVVAMVAPILWVNTIKEFKTKPLQNAVKCLQGHGLQLDVILCRVDRAIPEKILQKVSNLANVPRECIFDAPDVSSIYEVPLAFYDRHVDDLFVDLFHLNRSSCRIHKYREVVEKYVNNHLDAVQIGIFGKYENCDEAYISLKEALIHAGIANDVKVEIKWIKAEDLEKYKDNRGVGKFFEGLHGIIVPGGFDNRGTEGKIRAIQYVREKKIPFLGICLGLQCAVVEYARNVCKLEGANSMEFDPETPYPVIHYIPGQENQEKKSATMRLGAYDCELVKDSLASDLYGSKQISERHRHRFEVNNEYLTTLEENGLMVSGKNPETGLVELMELSRNIHPYFIGTQAHPEFKSRLTSSAPLFKGLIAAAINKMKQTHENG
jgi:CTP synthase